LEQDGIFFLSSEIANTIRDLDLGVVSIRDLEGFFRKFKFESLEINIISTVSQEESRGKRLFDKLWTVGEYTVKYHKVLASDQIIKPYEKIAEEYKRNSIFAYVSQNYPIEDIRRCKHLKIGTDVSIEKLEFVKDIPLNSVIIYQEEDKNHKEAIFNVLYDKSDFICYGNMNFKKNELRVLRLSTSEIMSFLRKVEAGEKIASYFPQFHFIEGIKEKFGICSMHLLQIREDGIYTKFYGEDFWIGEINDSYENLLLRLTNVSRVDRVRTYKMIEVIFYYVSRLSIQEPYKISNILFSSMKNSQLSDYVWPFLGIRTEQYLYIIDIEERKIKKTMKKSLSLENLFNEGFGHRLLENEGFKVLHKNIKEAFKI